MFCFGLAVAIGLGAMGLSPRVFCAQNAGTGTSALARSEVYPNSVDGLRRLLTDMVSATKNDDKSKLWAMITGLEVPSYESWFPQMFGAEAGGKLAAMYGRSVKTSGIQFGLLCEELSKGHGEFSIQKVDATKTSTPPTSPLDAYRVEWKKTDSSPGPDAQTVGVFYFVDGSFRLDGSFHEIRILSSSGNRGPVMPAKLINRVQPIYPDTARKMGLQGTVAINVIIHKDGTVTVENVGAGNPLLAPAALAAVQQWKYEPATVGGEPAECETKLLVTFALAK